MKGDFFMKHEIEDNRYQISEEAGCPAIGYQDVTVCVPAAIKPFGQVGNATVQCLGKPTVLPGCSHCPGKSETVCKSKTQNSSTCHFWRKSRGGRSFCRLRMCRQGRNRLFFRRFIPGPGGRTQIGRNTALRGF